MQRRLRITLAAVAAAGVAVLGAGTAEAQGVFKSDNHCPRFDKDKPEKEADFPSYGEQEAERNTTSKDLLDRRGDPYYSHNQFCDAPRPWRGWDWHDNSYDTLRNKKNADGIPVQDKDKNTFNDWDGYNRQYRKDKEKHLEPDHIGAPKHPKYATE